MFFFFSFSFTGGFTSSGRIGEGVFLLLALHPRYGRSVSLKRCRSVRSAVWIRYARVCVIALLWRHALAFHIRVTLSPSWIEENNKSVSWASTATARPFAVSVPAISHLFIPEYLDESHELWPSRACGCPVFCRLCGLSECITHEARYSLLAFFTSISKEKKNKSPKVMNVI